MRSNNRSPHPHTSSSCVRFFSISRCMSSQSQSLSTPFVFSCGARVGGTIVFEPGPFRQRMSDNLSLESVELVVPQASPAVGEISLRVSWRDSSEKPGRIRTSMRIEETWISVAQIRQCFSVCSICIVGKRNGTRYPFGITEFQCSQKIFSGSHYPLSYPFTAPAVSPWISAFSNKKKSTSGGIAKMIAMQESIFQYV